MEELCRQLGVINDISKKKTENIINILHLVLIAVKLAILVFITYNIVNLIDNNIDRLLEFVSKHNSLSFIDNNELKNSLYLIVIIIIFTLVMLVMDIIDLVINRERPFGQLIFIAAINYCFQLLSLSYYTNYEFGNLLLISMLEPLLYISLICVVYIRMQYNNKIYHKLLEKEYNNKINLTKGNR